MKGGTIKQASIVWEHIFLQGTFRLRIHCREYLICNTFHEKRHEIRELSVLIVDGLGNKTRRCANVSIGKRRLGDYQNSEHII